MMSLLMVTEPKLAGLTARIHGKPRTWNLM